MLVDFTCFTFFKDDMFKLENSLLKVKSSYAKINFTGNNFVKLTKNYVDFVSVAILLEFLPATWARYEV